MQKKLWRGQAESHRESREFSKEQGASDPERGRGWGVEGWSSVTVEAWGQELNSGPVGSLWLLYEQVVMDGKRVEKGWNTIGRAF